MNTLILDFLNSYADNTNPQYAVMLKGKWGCGKTHLIKEWKKRFDGYRRGNYAKAHLYFDLWNG